jgi:3-phenylpropionate/trans-cinnamate dioxygenase ferredoxin subunit
MTTVNKSDIEDGLPYKVQVGDMPVCVTRVNGEIFAFADTCSHSDASLSEGEINGYKIECWLHGAEFDIRTGEALTPPATEAIRTFSITDNGETVEII